MKKIKFYSLSLLMFLTFYSCKKDINVVDINEESVSARPLIGIDNCSATIQNGFIAFESGEDVEVYYKYLESHSDADIDRMEEQNDFMSYNRKIESILREYEVLNEDRSTTMPEILAFREKYKEYITITDEDFFPKIDGISNRLINSEGYIQVYNDVSKYVNQNIYTTDIKNIALLENNSFSNELIGKTEVKMTEVELDSNTTSRVYAGNSLGRKSAAHSETHKCHRYHNSYMSIRYFENVRVPGWGQAGYVVAESGFHYYLKNKKRGWTGIWYGQSRYARNQGSYTSTYYGRSFNDSSNSITTSRTYGIKTWWAPYSGNYVNAWNWAHTLFFGVYGHIDGIVTYDVCGTRHWNY